MSCGTIKHFAMAVLLIMHDVVIHSCVALRILKLLLVWLLLWENFRFAIAFWNILYFWHSRLSSVTNFNCDHKCFLVTFFALKYSQRNRNTVPRFLTFFNCSVPNFNCDRECFLKTLFHVIDGKSTILLHQDAWCRNSKLLNFHITFVKARDCTSSKGAETLETTAKLSTVPLVESRRASLLCRVINFLSVDSKVF